MTNSKRDWTDDERDVDDAEENDLDDFRTASSSNSGASGLTERLADILLEEGDGDLLLQPNDREDVLQFLRALDLQVVGACRADERLKPLLKLHVSGGGSEDCLLSHLSRHFEPSEVGMLARCLCIPLVSIRAGKINKQGALLCPTETRGNLDITLLPTSDLRITFVGDDGKTERLTTIKRAEPSASVEKISADNSGRSFLIKKMMTPKGGEVSYFWCSEKSKVVGDELLNKMKDLMEKKPSLAELTGICESRLDLFAAHIRTALNSNPETLHDDAGPSYPPTQSRSHNQAGKQHNSLHQGSLLGPRSSSFKECPSRKEKLKRQFSSSIDDLAFCASAFLDTKVNKNKIEVVEESDTFTFLTTPSSSSSSQLLPIPPSLFSPQYCFITSSSSSLPYNNTIPSQQIPVSLTEPYSLPPHSSLLTPSADEADRLLLPKGFFPTLLPVSAAMQHIPTFTPLICEPIVHIPVMDVLCSSGGQGYIVSTGPSLHQNLVVDPSVEKGARETLRMLLSSSSQSNNPQLIGMFPPGALTETDKRQNVVGLGSRGEVHYTGVEDINVLSSRISALGLVSSLSSDQAVGFGKRWMGGGGGSSHENSGDCVSDMSVPPAAAAYMEEEGNKDGEEAD